MINSIINYKEAEDIVRFAYEKGLDVESFESVLVDEYIITANNKLFVRGIPRSKYIILQSHFISAWSSGLKVILTNSDKKASKWVAQRTNF